MQIDERAKRFNKRRAERILEACRVILEQVRPYAYEKPLEYLEATVNLDSDITTAASGLIRIREVTPYIVTPIEHFALRGKHRVTVQAVEQSAKSSLWKLGLMWRQKYLPGPAGIIYQNKEVGQNIIRDSFLPILRCDPEFETCLPKREGEAPTRLKLPYSVLYLMTGDSAIISFPMAVIIGDEINKWRLERANRRKLKLKKDEDYQVSKVKDMDKRLRTFHDSIRVLVCSPEGKKAPITQEFNLSSKGFYHCRCASCGELSFNTTTPEEYFVFDTTDDVVVPGSIRLKCPACGYMHTEEKHKRLITTGGDYIHERPELIDVHAGFCWGALATQMPGLDWLEICTAINAANVSHSYETQAYLHNSIKGVDYSPNIVTGEKLKLIRTHFVPELPEKTEEKFCAVYLAVDTQEVGYWFSVLAVDTDDNWYTLDYGFAWDDDAVIQAWNREYMGLQPSAGIIDEGGHRKPEVDDLLLRLGNGFFKYKGEAGTYKGNFRISDEDPYLIKGKARYYNAKWLYMIYSQKQRNNNYWYVACELKKTFVQQMAAVQPPEGQPDADFEDWTPGERQHDLFDCHKMALLLHDFALRYFGEGFWLNMPSNAVAVTSATVKPPSRPLS